MLRLLRYLFAFIALGFAITSLSAAASTSSLDAKGDWKQYLQNGLPIPSPLVVYVYASSGSLVGVIEMHVGDNADFMSGIKAAIVTRDFKKFSTPQISVTDTTLKKYLFDMGYSMDALVSSKTPYTLLLAELGLHGEDCGKSLKVRNRIEQVVRAAAQQPSAQDMYTVSVLELEPSANFKIECRDTK